MADSQTTVTGLGTIRTSDPVNLNHPLNQGRVAWWMALPHLASGPTWTDLMGLNHGTLTGMGNAANGWRSTTRPGGSGHVLFDGATGYIATPLVLAPAFTVAAWERVPAAPGGFPMWLSAPGSPDFELGYSASNVFYSGNSFLTSTYGADDGNWHRILFAVGGGTATFYLDGRPRQTVSYTPTTFSGPLYIGEYYGNGYRFGGEMDDVGVWNRKLTDPLAWLDFDLSRGSYPGVMNRY